MKEQAYQLLKQRLSSNSISAEHKAFIREALSLAFDTKNMNPLKHALYLRDYPVSVEEFLFSNQYLFRPKNELYPVVVDTLIDVCEKHGRVLNRITEFVGTGGIGVAKTSISQFINLYQLYLLSCYKKPHTVFNLDSASEIAFIFQSLSGKVAKDVDYARFRAYCEQSPYFTQSFKFDKYIKSQLVFPNRILASPMSGDNSSIGQNVIGGIIDEVNFMSIIQASAKTRDNSVYDQAKVIYDSVSRRIKSRFVNEGGGAGILCLVSSKHYPEEFTDKKIEESLVDPTIYVYDKRVWEVKPKGTYSPETFPLFVGSLKEKPKLILPNDDITEYSTEQILDVPINFKSFFEKDLLGSLRDIAGVTQVYTNSYIANYLAVDNAFKGKSILTKQEHSFMDNEPSLGVNTSELNRSPLIGIKYNRWVHIDLSQSGDATGIACGYIDSFVPVVNPDGSFSNEMMPKIKLDFVLRVKAPPNDEIKFYKIRELLYKLKQLGLPIKWVTFDQFQSTDSIQLLRQKGFSTGRLSVDLDTVAYELTKHAIYENRLIGVEHEECVKELKAVQEVRTGSGKTKIDHVIQGVGKDCADAVAGVVKGLTTRRELWFAHGVSPTSFSEKLSLLQSIAENNTKEEV